MTCPLAWKAGPYYYWIALLDRAGVDERPVRADRIRKSLGAENTFSADIYTFEAACEVLRPIIEKVWRTCEGAEIRGRTESAESVLRLIRSQGFHHPVERVINFRRVIIVSAQPIHGAGSKHRIAIDSHARVSNLVPRFL